MPELDLCARYHQCLVAKQQEGFNRILAIYASCFIVALPIRTAQIYFTAKLGLIWREWLSSGLIDEYLSNRAYYVLNPNDEQSTGLDNPDQRITDDVKAFTGAKSFVHAGYFLMPF